MKTDGMDTNIKQKKNVPCGGTEIEETKWQSQ